jgi:hypothetical protein
MILRNSLLCLAISLFAGCGSVQKQANSININQDKAGQLFKGQKNVMILSCVRCGCFIQALPAAYIKDRSFFESVYLLTDTTCNSLKFIKNHIPQQEIDGISNEIYNIALFKKSNEKGEYKFRIIETKENAEILAICKDFFK